MAMPMIIVGLMVGSIFGLLTAVGADMVGGAAGLGNRLTYYSSMIRMPQFFAVILILAIMGISIYVLFYLARQEMGRLGSVMWVGKRVPRRNRHGEWAPLRLHQGNLEGVA